MIDYFSLFPEKCLTELRTAKFSDAPSNSLPDGTYVFSEWFCPDLDCDCQRVIIKVLYVREEGQRPKDVAAIGYTWNENNEGWKEIIAELPNPYLDVLHPQSRYADELMDFWHGMLLSDSKYAARLERHYHELRAEQPESASSKRIDQRHSPKGPLALSRKDRKRRVNQLEKKRRSQRP